jgi:hypothetical protein
MTAIASSHPAPHRQQVRLWLLIFGLIAAPLLWLAQLLLGYGISAALCYGGDHPTTIAAGAPLRMVLFAFDAGALCVALIGVVVSYASWCTVRVQTDEGRTRFMALWGIMSSLCFLVAIIFNTLASVMAPLCIR